MIGRRARHAAASILLLGVSVGALAAAAPEGKPKATVQAPQAAAPAKDPTQIEDPAVTRGTLPNGMRYAILPNKVPPGAVSLRLGFQVGSYEENEDERGFAHFVEHMAFRSTKNAPDGVLDNRFASFGVTLGQDQNAYTALDSTVYRVDLPGSDPDDMRQVLEWMRDAAGNVVFAPQAVDAERRVVEAEIRTRSTPLQRLQRATATFMSPELRSAARDPGGSFESLAAATPDGLRAFYQRWYRPENAILVITGDVEPDAAAGMAKALFSDWSAAASKADRPTPEKLRDRPVDAHSAVDPTLPASVAACRLAPRDVERTASLDRLKTETMSALWVHILNERLRRQALAPGSSLIGGAATVSRDGPEARMTCAFAAPAEARWEESLAALQAELRRFAVDGPTEKEVSDAVDMIVRPAWSTALRAATRATPDIADAIVGAHLSGRVFQTPVDAADALEAATADATPALVKAAFARDWSGTGPLITATSAVPLDRKELLAAWTENEKADPLGSYADREKPSWIYTDFGRRGKVRKRRVIADPGFVRLEYANGVILNFKQTDFAAETAEVRIRFGHGERELTAETRQPLAFGAALLPAGGLGKLDPNDISEALGTTGWDFDVTADTDSWLISGSTYGSAILQEMQVLAAFFTDPGFRPIMDDKIPTILDMTYRMMKADPGAVARDAFEKALFPEQPSYPPREQLLKWRSSDYARMLKPLLASGPIEITVVGDVDEKSVRSAVASTFGALPKRAPLGVPSGPGPFKRFPEALPPSVTGFHEGGADKAGALLVWPLYVASHARRSEEYAIILAGTIFRDRLMQRIRMQMGKAYAPSVSTETPDDADQGFLAASFETSAADLDQAIAAAREIAREMAAGRMTQQELDAARIPLIADRNQALTRNEPWAGLLSLSHRHPEAIDELIRYREQVSALTLADVQRAAATWLARDPMVARSLPDPKTMAAAAAPPAAPGSAAQSAR
jgi:zinc protease